MPVESTASTGAGPTDAHRITRIWGRQEGAIQAKKMAELSGMSRAAVSALVATLEPDGLLRKDRAPYDGRAVQLRLTHAGPEAITSAFRAHNAREREWASSLTVDEQRSLTELLGELIAHFRALRRPAPALSSGRPDRQLL
ncbi:MarR family winged helix-turn-helix transcriptional regulator [Streptomyces sp. R39]|uniref:MarR family winged helix-turn-helix transcriptional regulator n=1 Tax=Streptomyces sp. R39 TaxID=3238631 RepID=A0AB39R055_9ACTN